MNSLAASFLGALAGYTMMHMLDHYVGEEFILLGMVTGLLTALIVTYREHVKMASAAN